MRDISAKAALILADSRQLDTADIADVLGEYESEIAQLLSARKIERAHDYAAQAERSPEERTP